MRVLLLTDTHGKIDQINAFAAKYNAQACIHCGDIGLFDYESIRSLPAEELTKIIRHSPVSEGQWLGYPRIRRTQEAFHSLYIDYHELYYLPHHHESVTSTPLHDRHYSFFSHMHGALYHD
jgi:hypothetical protein